jgi:hypothetical protein
MLQVVLRAAVVQCRVSNSPISLLLLTGLQGKDIQSGEMLAIKVYNLNALGELNKVQLIREIRLHGSFVHRNIIELYCAYQVRLRLRGSFTVSLPCFRQRSAHLQRNSNEWFSSCASHSGQQGPHAEAMCDHCKASRCAVHQGGHQGEGCCAPSAPSPPLQSQICKPPAVCRRTTA